jgi:GTP cyclohydrolase I
MGNLSRNAVTKSGGVNRSAALFPDSRVATQKWQAGRGFISAQAMPALADEQRHPKIFGTFCPATASNAGWREDRIQGITMDRRLTVQHHMASIIGRAHIAYLPDRRVTR